MAEVRRGQGQKLEAERARANTARQTQEQRTKMAQVMKLSRSPVAQQIIAQQGQAQALQSSANQAEALVAVLSGLTGTQSGKATAGSATASMPKLEQRLSNIRAGRLDDTQLATRVAKVISNVTGMQMPSVHHDGEAWERDLNFVAGDEPRKKMMKVFNSLYNVFGPEGNSRLQELIFRNKEYFGAGIQRRPENDHYDHLHYGFGA